jgi:hypothetical protein
MTTLCQTKEYYRYWAHRQNLDSGPESRLNRCAEVEIGVALDLKCKKYEQAYDLIMVRYIGHP